MAFSIQLITVGQKAPQWCNEAVSEYQQRLKHFAEVTLTDLPLSPNHKNNPSLAKKEEGEKIISSLWQDSYIVLLDEKGKSFTSMQLSEKLSTWQTHYAKMSLVIGGPAGLNQTCFEKANLTWSLSALTLPHRLVKVVLLEQLYRAYSILDNHPYHRE